MKHGRKLTTRPSAILIRYSIVPYLYYMILCDIIIYQYYLLILTVKNI